MFVRDFNFNLPAELIAQHPLKERDHSRLLVLNRDNQTRSNHFFYEIDKFLKPGDLLVFNNTRVIPARLFAFKVGSDGSGGAKIEVFLLKQTSPNIWECLVRPGKRIKPGALLMFKENLMAEVLAVTPAGGRIVKFPDTLDFHAWLLRNGETPLPPYITEKLDNPERYQTIYSQEEGSVAAPTAGLHFTDRLFQKLNQVGVQQGFLTLHVGLGTFRPVQVERIEDHAMHAEFFTLPPELVTQIRLTKQSGGRVIAVGTTTVRVLESQTTETGLLSPCSGETSIFIYPGYQFKLIDGLITNFHLPRSTLLMLVSAFAGKEFVLKSYEYAVEEKYRFFSFGDSMLIL